MAGTSDFLPSPITSTAGLLRDIDAFLRKRTISARGALIVASGKEDPASVLKRRISGTEVVWQTKAGALVRLSRSVKKGEGEERKRISGEALIVPTSHARLFLAVTLDSPDFATRVLRPLIDRCSPRIFLPRITSKSVAAVLQVANKAEGLESFEVRDISVRSRMEHRKGRRFRSERIRTGESLEEALSLLKERGQWIHSAGFNYVLADEKQRVFRCNGRISRECCFTAENDFAWFYANVLTPAQDEVVDTLKFYSNRARQETVNHAPRPIIIEYPEAVFSDKAKHQRLIQSLKRLKRSSISVLHANPYFRSSLVDFTDGSAYELWILSQSRIIVTPQFRATSASMGRVIDHILTDFGEGEVRDYRETVDG